VHNPVGNVPVVREEEKPLGVAIQPTNRVDPLWHINEIHNRPSAALVARGGDVTRRFVEEDRARALRTEESTIDANLSVERVNLRS